MFVVSTTFFYVRLVDCVISGFDLFSIDFSLVNWESLAIFGLSNTNLTFIYGLVLSVYFFGLFGLLINLKSILISLLFVELVYFSIIVHFLFLAMCFDLYFCFVYALLFILIAAAESVIGLGLVILLFRFQRNITFDSLSALKC